MQFSLVFPLMLGALAQEVFQPGVVSPTQAYINPIRTTDSFRRAPIIATTSEPQQKPDRTPEAVPQVRFQSTYTKDGKVFGCTALATLREPFQAYTAGHVYCTGTVTPIGTTASTSTIQPTYLPIDTTSAPTSTCTPVTSSNDSENSYCQCDDGTFMPRNLYTNGQETKELCEGDPNTPDGDWFPVPKAGPLAPWMEDANTGCIPNVTENINSECWNKLHLSEYTKWWWQTFKSVCKSHGKTTPFADCFLDKMFGGPVQCTKVTTTADCNKPKWNEEGWNGARNFYVAYTIWGMNQFFNQYWTALSDARETIGGDLGSIKNIVDPPDPPEPKESNLDKIFGVLSFGLAFLPPPFGGISSSIVNGADSALGLADTFFPPKPAKSVPKVNYDEVNANIDNILQEIRASIDSGCSKMLSEADIFIGFATNGAFTRPLPALKLLTDHLKKRLNTFMVATALSSIGVIVGRAENTDIRAVQASGQKLHWEVNCPKYNDQNICDTYWFDKKTKTTYSLLNPGNNEGQPLGHNFNEEMMNLFPKYTTPEELFRDSYACMSGGNTQTPSLMIYDGKAKEKCMANMMVCTWETKTPKNYDFEKSRNRLFLDCKTTDVLPAVGRSCFSEQDTLVSGHLSTVPASTKSFRVPRGYLGWGLYDNDLFEDTGLRDVCNDK